MTKTANNSKYQTISEKQLVHLYKDTNTASSVNFCFLIGAGASLSSGIPLGSELAQRWFEEIKQQLNDEQLKAWIDKEEIDENNLAEAYPLIYEKRFESNVQMGYDHLQHIMKEAEPNIGYLILAMILDRTNHRFVLTTNFDHLVEDSLYQIGAKKPLVCGHEDLARFISLQSERATVIKVHRDLLLEPINDPKNVSSLHEKWKQSLKQIVSQKHLLVIGYGGNDGSLMDYLTNISPEDRKPIYWCYRKGDELSDKTKDLLTSRDFLIEINSFDELMYLLNKESDFSDEIQNINANPDDNLIINAARERVKKHKDIISKLANRYSEEPSNEASHDMEIALEKILPHWWSLQQEINKISDPDQKNDKYLEAIKTLPESHELISNYALFLV